MSFRQSVIPKQKSLLQQSTLQKNGNKVRDHLRQLQKTINTLKLRHSSQSIDFIQQECKFTKLALRTLQETRTKGRGQELQKQKLVSYYSQQLKKIIDSFHSYQQDINQSPLQSHTQPVLLQAQAYQQELFTQRHKELVKVEGALSEINDFMKFCASTVNQQGEMLELIDEYAQTSVEQTKKGVLELQKAQEHQKSSRNVCWVVGLAAVLVVLVLAIVTIFATKQMEESYVREINEIFIIKLVDKEVNYTGFYFIKVLNYLEKGSHKNRRVLDLAVFLLKYTLKPSQKSSKIKVFKNIKQCINQVDNSK